MAAELNSDAPKSFGVVLFPGFQALDAFGPLDALNVLSLSVPLKLAVLSSTLEPVSTSLPPSRHPRGASTTGQSILPTHTFEDAPDDLDFLLVPGGAGVRLEADVAPHVEFLKRRAKTVKCVMSVCTGAVLLARAGLLDGCSATTNKASWEWATSQGPKTHWIADARWVVDGQIWTTSGVSAGLDGFLAFIAVAYGEAKADETAAYMEHPRRKEPRPDEFAKLHGVKDVPPRTGR